MTRKDYALLSEVIAQEVAHWRGQPYGNGKRRVLESLAARLGTRLAAENPRFDMRRFVADCLGGVCEKSILGCPSVHVQKDTRERNHGGSAVTC